MLLENFAKVFGTVAPAHQDARREPGSFAQGEGGMCFETRKGEELLSASESRYFTLTSWFITTGGICL